MICFVDKQAQSYSKTCTSRLPSMPNICHFCAICMHFDSVAAVGSGFMPPCGHIVAHGSTVSGPSAEAATQGLSS